MYTNLPILCAFVCIYVFIFQCGSVACFLLLRLDSTSDGLMYFSGCCICHSFPLIFTYPSSPQYPSFRLSHPFLFSLLYSLVMVSCLLSSLITSSHLISLRLCSPLCFVLRFTPPLLFFVFFCPLFTILLFVLISALLYSLLIVNFS